MKKLILLFVLIPVFSFGDISEWNGMTINTSTNINGCPGFSSLNGATVASAGAGTDYTQLASCVAAWMMTGSTTETDVSGNGETLTTSAGDSIPTSSDVPSGYSGTSRDFELDDSEYLYVADGGSTDLSGADQQISIVFWIKSETTGITQYPVYKWGGGVYAYNCYTNFNNPVFSLRDAANTTTTLAFGTTSCMDGTWHHVALVSNDTDMRVYIDGVLDSNGANNPKTYSAGINNSSSNFLVGYSVDGLMKEVGVFNTALTAEQVLEIKTYGLDGKNGG